SSCPASSIVIGRRFEATSAGSASVCRLRKASSSFTAARLALLAQGPERAVRSRFACRLRRGRSAKVPATTSGTDDRRSAMDRHGTELAQTVSVVAGGTGALGRAVSLAFLAAGAVVAATYRKQAELDDLARAAGANAARLEGHQVDIADEAAVRRLVDTIVARHG